MQQQPNNGREEREVGLELYVTGCYYGGRSTSHAKAQRRTRPDIETRGDIRDSERELASELPRTEQQHYRQEDEGPDRPSPPHLPTKTMVKLITCNFNGSRKKLASILSCSNSRPRSLSHSTLARQGRGLARTGTHTGSPPEPPKRLR